MDNTKKRLDKILAESGYGTRKEVTGYIKRGLVTVDCQIVKEPDVKVSISSNVCLSGERIDMPRDVVCIMNKPSGFVCSTDDPRDRTVMELLPEYLIKQHVVPAGRLDKDTEGLLVFSNNGDLIHRLISPKSSVSKTYEVSHTGSISEKDISDALKGIQLKDGTTCKPAFIKDCTDGNSTIVITEGMYHQVKRMYAVLGKHVTGLKRTGIGGIKLGNLCSGETRELNTDEINLLFL